MLKHGEIPKSWSPDLISDHISFEGGTQPPRSTFLFKETPGYIRLVQTRDFKTDRYKTYIPKTANHKTFENKDVMIGRYGPPVFQVYRGLSGAYNVALIKASPKSEEIDPDYLYYTLKQRRLFRLIDALSQRSSGQTGVDMDALNNFPLPLPPLSEQRSIAKVLRTWDEAIERMETFRSMKLELRKGIIQQLLGSGKEGMMEWPLKRLSELSQRIKRTTDGKVHPVMTISAKSGFLMQSDKFARNMAGKSIERYTLLLEGEFAFNKGNSKTAPYGCIFRLGRQSALIPFVYYCFKMDDDLHHPFYEHLFATGALNHQLSRLINSGVRNDGLFNLYTDDFFGCQIPVPPFEDQVKIARAITALNDELSLIEAEIAAVKRQKSGLMQKLLTGEWRVGVDGQGEANA